MYCPAEDSLIKRYDNTDSIRFENNLLIDRKGIQKDAGGVKGKTAIEDKKVFQVATTAVLAVPFDFMNNPEVNEKFGQDKYVGAVQSGVAIPAIPDKNLYGPVWYKK